MVDIDDYETCARTFATLCICSDRLAPDLVSARLKIAPTRVHKKGDVAVAPALAAKTNVWQLSTHHNVFSKDSRRHFDWLFDKIAYCKDEIDALRQDDCQISLWCFWASKYGEGGPTLSLPQIRMLAAFEIEVLFDIVFEEDPD